MAGESSRPAEALEGREGSGWGVWRGGACAGQTGQTKASLTSGDTGPHREFGCGLYFLARHHVTCGGERRAERRHSCPAAPLFAASGRQHRRGSLCPRNSSEFVFFKQFIVNSFGLATATLTRPPMLSNYQGRDALRRIHIII